MCPGPPHQAWDNLRVGAKSVLHVSDHSQYLLSNYQPQWQSEKSKCVQFDSKTHCNAYG